MVQLLTGTGTASMQRCWFFYVLSRSTKRFRKLFCEVRKDMNLHYFWLDTFYYQSNASVKLKKISLF